MIQTNRRHPSTSARFLAALAGIFVVIVSLAGCSASNPYFDPSRSHHTTAGFINNYPPNPAYMRPEIGFVEAWTSRMRNWTTESPSRAPVRDLAPVKPNLELIHSKPTGKSALTWIGHASFLLQTGSGLNILTDPVFDDRASPLTFAGPRRHQPPGLAIAELPHVDIVLISHSH